MPARLVFLAATVAGAVSCAVLAALTAVLAGLCAGMPGDALVTLAADTAAAVFGGVIALSGMAAGLFLSPPDTARQHDAADAGRPPGIPRLTGTASPGDSRLRAAVAAYALALHETRDKAPERGRHGGVGRSR